MTSKTIGFIFVSILCTLSFSVFSITKSADTSINQSLDKGESTNKFDGFIIPGVRVENIDKSLFKKRIGSINGKWSGFIDGKEISFDSDEHGAAFIISSEDRNSEKSEAISRKFIVTASFSRRGSIIEITNASCMIKANKTTWVLKNNGCSVISSGALLRVLNKSESKITIDTGGELLILSKKQGEV